MRFTLAAVTAVTASSSCWLLANKVIYSDVDVDVTDLTGASNVHDENAAMLLALDIHSKDGSSPLATSTAAAIVTSSFRTDNKKKKENRQQRFSALVNHQQQQHHGTHNGHLVECDPSESSLSSSSSSPYADVGVLACDGNTCQENTASSLGGFCTTVQSTEDPIDSRKLQDGSNVTALDQVQAICDLSETFDDFNCEQCTADNASYTASFDCSYTSYCVSVPSPCSDDTTVDFCGTETAQGIVTAPGSYSTEYCYSYDQPLQFNYCINLIVNDGEFSCELDIGGTKCNSCSISFDPENQALCQNFDCTNTDLGSSGSTCGLRFIEALAVGYFYSNVFPCSSGCNLCGEGGAMANPSATFPYGDGEDLNCFSAQTDAFLGNFASFQCEELAGNVSPCGCQAGGRNPTPPAPTTSDGGPTSAPTPSGAPVDGSFGNWWSGAFIAATAATAALVLF